MAETFHLKIVASDKQFFDGDCETVIFPAIDGYHGILPRHEPMVTALTAGELKFRVEGEWRLAAVSDGFVEILPDTVTILTDTCERPEDIDVKRAEEAAQRAEERLRQKESMREYTRTQAALSRAMARLKVTGKGHP